MNPEFLDVDDVIFIHGAQIEAFGGASDIRDMRLLESAVAQPMATFGGEFLHIGLFEMAAAYLFHIVMNHPFVDGNKRTGFSAATTFLRINGIVIDGSHNGFLYEITMLVAKGEMGKGELAALLSCLVWNTVKR